MMKNDELKREKQLQVLMDLSEGILCVSEANTKIREIHARTEPKEQDVCPECGGSGRVPVLMDWADCKQCNGTGKAPVDKIREAYFKQKVLWNANCDFDIEGDRFILRSPTMDPIHEERENREYKLFKSGYKSQQADIELLNLEIIRLGGSIDLMVKSEEAKDKEIERLKRDKERIITLTIQWKQKACDRYNHEVLPMRSEIERLKAENEDLRCCGNCHTDDSQDCKECTRNESPRIDKVLNDQWKSLQWRKDWDNRSKENN